ncbi:MAG: aminotransferase class I/II-fold pyridoxal phosphate-dependent enzyme [Acidimicrobiia bacterium]|nr:aminotransferase class I/II-fold pyridoxal phosphate-dependent enzyme [Acidimicrobiia bacterium]
MRSGSASRHERILRVFERHITQAIDAGLCRIRVDDQDVSGRTITAGGQELVNFGSCAYLGLNVDPRLKRGAIEAIERFGPVFSSSTAYTSIDLYTSLETRLRKIFDAPVIVPTTTTLGHLSALPVLIGEGDAVVIDGQAHSSIHMATQLLIAEGITVIPVAHNDIAVLNAALADLTPRHRSVWYLADGVYSMLGDAAPVAEIHHLLERYENLNVYIDDAHGFGWQGPSGRGLVLGRMPMHERMVVAVSLSKSFGSGGAAIAFPNEELANRVQLVSGPMTFSGPVHPAELGAAVAAADIHLSDEHPLRQARLLDQIKLVRDVAVELELPIPALDETPIWFARIGSHEDAAAIGQRLRSDGFYVNLASFPAVPLGQSGLRFTQTLYHQDSDLIAMLEAMARHITDVAPGSLRPDILIDLTDSSDITNDIEAVALTD